MSLISPSGNGGGMSQRLTAVWFNLSLALDQPSPMVHAGLATKAGNANQ